MPFNPPMLLKRDTFGIEEYEAICEFIQEKIEHLDRRLNTFRTSTLPEYVKLYKGQPKKATADWPWDGASNIVIPLVGTYSDELLARIMGGIWMYDPLWTADLAGDTPSRDGEEQKEVYQKFLQDMAYDPQELDLYRVSNAFNLSACRYGTGVVHFPWEYQKEIEYVYMQGGAEGSDPQGREQEFVSRDGPHPELVPLNRWGFDPNCPCLENMKFFYHIESLDYWDMKNLRGKSTYYKQEDINEMLSSPDASQEDEMEQVFNEYKKIENSSITTGSARWYIHHIVCNWQRQGSTYSLFARYHKRTKKVLFITFNNYPKNLKPYEDAKLAYDEESYLGTGFAEMMKIFQQEISNNVNWRTNNRNYAMLGVWRVSPESKLSSILDFFPGVAVPARENEIELIKSGADIGYSDGPDQFMMACSKERAGIDPAIGGTGGGIVNPKRGIYSAAGTSMTLGQQNNRNSLRTSDMRSAHVKIGTKLGIMYANIGIGDRLKRYGSNAEALKKALDNVVKGDLGLRLRPTSAALNKELERQNDILLSDRLERYYTQQAQIIEAMLNPQAPPQMKEYFAQSIVAGRVMMQALLRNFNKNNVDAYLPQVKQLIDQIMNPKQQGAGNAGAAGNPNVGGLNSVPRLPQGFMGAGGALPSGSQTSSLSL
jgi:hypothetical protein